MSEARSNDELTARSADPARRMPAPWRVVALLLCLALAGGAGRLAWLEADVSRARAADPELMVLVAQAWVTAQGWAHGPSAAGGEDRLAVLQRDTQRVLALLAEQQTIERERSAALVAPRDRWVQAQQQLMAQARHGTADLGPVAQAASVTSKELLLALRQRAEQRQAPEVGGARPGAMLAVASIGLLLLGWRLPRRSASIRPLDSRLEEPVPSFLPSVLPEGDSRSLLLALQLDVPQAALAELPEGAAAAARELERQVRLRVRAALPGVGIERTEAPAGALRLDLRLADPGAATLRHALVQRLFEEMADAYTVQDHPLTLRASLGVAAPEQDAPEHAWRDTWAARDLACRRGGGIVIFNPELGARLAAARTLGDALAAAQASGDLGIHYQPVVELASGQLIGLRAEPVWQHGERGTLSHATYMAEAEALDCAVPAAEAAWRQALAQLATWRRELGARCPPWVSLPGWACVWEREDLAPFVQDLLAETGLPASALQVSLAEPLLAAGDGVVAQVSALRAIGVAVVLEGLGQASASLSWLARLPVSAVAIDRMFVAELPGHEAHQVLVKAIVSLADTQGLATCADGVESAEQRDALLALGVQSAQGRWLGERRAAAATHDWLEQRRP